MSQEFNPYQPPQTLTPMYAVAPAQAVGGVWREGRLLVMHRMATLPPRCVKSNEPVEVWLKRKLNWHHPAIYLALLLNLIIYIVLVLAMGKKATIQIGLSQRWATKRQIRMLIAWFLFFAGIGVIWAAIALGNSDGSGPMGVISGLLLSVGAAIYGLLACRLVYPKKMDDQYIWLAGVHPDYLAALPPVPGT